MKATIWWRLQEKTATHIWLLFTDVRSFGVFLSGSVFTQNKLELRFWRNIEHKEFVKMKFFDFPFLPSFACARRNPKLSFKTIYKKNHVHANILVNSSIKSSFRCNSICSIQRKLSLSAERDRLYSICVVIWRFTLYYLVNYLPSVFTNLEYSVWRPCTDLSDETLSSLNRWYLSSPLVSF